MSKSRGRLLLVLVAILAPLWVPLPASASTSAHYQIQEDYIGGGGLNNASSAHYQARDSIGGLGGGLMGGTLYKVFGGTPTPDEPNLSFAVTAATVNLGSFSSSIARTGTSTFSVLNYTSYGYNVQIIGTPPTMGSHALAAMSSGGSSTVGTEQFGINLTANTSPTTFGAVPQQQPDSTFGFGAAASGYNTANSYKYNSGDIIANATKSSGITNYTVSYLANISNLTPGGSYTTNLTFVCTGTY